MTPCQKLLKQEGTARRIESMQQSSATPSLHLWFLGVAEDCCMLSILLAVPSCFNSFWHGVIPTSYFIFNDFYTCIHIHVHPAHSACIILSSDKCTCTYYYYSSAFKDVELHVESKGDVELTDNAAYTVASTARNSYQEEVIYEHVK